MLPGGSQTFTASADSGFVIGQWYLDGSPAQYGTGSLTVTNLQANHSVFVAFRPLDDLGVTVNTDPGPVELEEDAEIPLGSNFVYQIEVVNKGLNPASNVTVTNTLPSGVNYVGATSTQGSISYASGIVAVQIGAMASGQTVIVLITVSAASLGDQDDLVQVSGSAVEPYTDNNSASVTVDISPP